MVDITSPANGSSVTYRTELFGTVSDTNIQSTLLEYSRLNSGRWNTIASKSIVTDGTISATNAKLGVFDPTLLENDQYEVRLTAKDINGLTASDSIVLNVLGHAKIGGSLRSVPGTFLALAN